MNWLNILLSAAAGIIGTGIGGILGVSCKGKRETSDALSLAGGIMLGVVAFEMLPEAVSCCKSVTKFGALIATCCALVTVALAGIVEAVASRVKERRQRGKFDGEKPATSLRCERERGPSLQEVEVQDFERLKRHLKQAGLAALFAIALHNIPEGMAIGASGAANLKMGVLVTVIIGIHNVPEGMAITAPLVGGGTKPLPAVLLAFLAGSTTLVGGVIGAILGEASPLASGLSLGFAAGVMLYVACFELLPSATKISGKFHAVSFFFGVAIALVLSVLL